MNNYFIWEIFSKLPEKRQKRLEDKFSNMDIEISLNEITIMRETEESILAMVPCVSDELENSLYVEYFFDSGLVEIKHMVTTESFWKRLKYAFCHVFKSKHEYKKESTIIDMESLEKLTDFLSSIIEDIYSQLEAEKDNITK